MNNHEKRLEKIVENSTAGYFFIDKAGVFRQVNDAWVKMYKYDTQEEIIGHHFTEIQRLEDKELSNEFVQEIMNNNPAYLTGEFSRKCKDGSIGYHSFSANPVIEKARVIGIEGFIIDISKRKSAEEKLSYYEKIVSNTPDMMALLDKNYTYLAVNKSYCLAFNLTTEQFVGKIASDVFGEDVFRSVIKPKADRCMNGEIINFKDRFDFPAYKQCYMEINYFPYYDNDKQIKGFVVNGRDITVQNQMENALKESEEKYRVLYDNAPLAYQSLDETGHFIDVNPAWLNILGYKRDEVIGQNYGDFLHPTWEEVFAKNFPAFIQRGYVHDVQYKIRKKDGDYLDISFEGCIGYYPDGSFRQTYCVFQDITDRLNAEHKLKEYQENLEEIVKERTQRLELQYADLVAMNKVFVGREFRIKELRDEVKLLKEKLDK